MDKIVCFIGESCSGKTVLAKELEKQGYNVIQSYTTRPPREENEWGHTFATMELYYQHKQAGIVIADKEVYTGVMYWATTKQYKGKGVSIYIVDPEGFKTLKENVKDAQIVGVYIKTDTETRRARLANRPETENRIEKDYDVFKFTECDYVVDGNRPTEDILSILFTEQLNRLDKNIGEVE